MSVPATQLNATLAKLAIDRSTPLLVGLDGRSAVGKSTLASQVAVDTGGAVIDGDDFYSGGTAAEWDAMTPAQKVAHCIDWRRQRPVLEALCAGKPAFWHPYDWHADDDRLVERPTTCQPAPIVILEGVYSARPELADLLDFRVLYEAPPEMRRDRLVLREGEDFRTDWNDRWGEAEEWYFGRVMPPEAFDLVLSAI
jgi:uridine kinase